MSLSGNVPKPARVQALRRSVGVVNPRDFAPNPFPVGDFSTRITSIDRRNLLRKAERAWGRPRISIRGLIVAVAVAGFDAAAMIRAVQQGRASHATFEYAVGFGLVLLVLNVVVLGLSIALSRPVEGATGSRLRATPSPMVILGCYVAVLAMAILSVLFFLSGRF